MNNAVRELQERGICSRTAHHSGPCNGTPRPIVNGFVCHNWPYDPYPNGVAPLRGYTSAERKDMPIQTVMAEYFPDAFAAVARHAKKANGKHNPGEPMYWARNKSTDHLNCAARHLLTPDAVDPDTNEIELVGAAWRCLAALQLREEARLVMAGIKPLSGVVS